MPATQLLHIKNATIKYRNQEFFTGLDFEIRKNEHWAIVGESGSGKSAFLQVLAGRYVISHGKIAHAWYEQYKKEHTISDPLFSYRNLISYVDVKHDFKNLIDKMAEISDLTIIYVTHHQETLPDCITKTLKLG